MAPLNESIALPATAQADARRVRRRALQPEQADGG